MATVGWWPPHTPGVLGFASPAVVNQAPAKSAPGLGPSGFHPHAFARAGLRAPLALRQGEPYPEFVTYDTGESLLARARPGDATAAIRICARLRKSPCSCPPPGQEAARPVDNCTARSGLCWASLAGRFCVRWLLHRNAFGDQGGAPLDPQAERCGLRPGDRRGDDREDGINRTLSASPVRLRQ